MKDKIIGLCMAVLLGLAIGWYVTEVTPAKSVIVELPSNGTVTYSGPCCSGR